ncbi:MAG: PilZ domain-containing protein [Spirochaetota bacterium]
MLRDVRIYFSGGETALIKKVTGEEYREALVDLSPNGIAVTCSTTYAKNEIVKIELDIFGEHLAFKGAVKRWQDEKKYVEFVYVNDENRAVIDDLLNRFGAQPKG